MPAGETRAPAGAIDEFLAQANEAFPSLRAARSDIRRVHHGLTPAATRGGRADLLAEPVVTRHSGDGAGVISLVGVKFTTARAAAERAVDLLGAELGGKLRRCRTASSPLPHADIADVEGRLIETSRTLGVALDRDLVEHLGGWYGTEASDVIRFAADAGSLDRLTGTHPALQAEIAYAVDHGQAQRLADAVLRRTVIGASVHPGQETLAQAAAIMGARLGWSDERRAAEIAAVDEIFAVTAP